VVRVPEPDAALLPRLLCALPASLRKLSLGQFACPVLVASTMRCLGDGRACRHLTKLTLQLQMRPESVAAVCRALASPTGCLASTVKHFYLIGPVAYPMQSYMDDVVSGLLDALEVVPNRPLEWLSFDPVGAPPCSTQCWYRLITLVTNGFLPRLRNPVGTFPHLPLPAHDGERVASFLVAAFEAGRFTKMEHLLSTVMPPIPHPALARLLAACPHTPLLTGPDDDDDDDAGDDAEEEEEDGARALGLGVGGLGLSEGVQQEQEEEQEEERAGAATLQTSAFRLEPKLESLWEVTAWLRRGMRGARGLALLKKLEVRCDELGPLRSALAAAGGDGSSGTATATATAIAALVEAALAAPQLETVMVAWRLQGWEDAGGVEGGFEGKGRDAIIKTLRDRIRPPPEGHHLESILTYVKDQRGWRTGVLAIAARVPGARPRALEAEAPEGATFNTCHWEFMARLGCRPAHVDRVEYRFVRLATARAGAGGEHGRWPGAGGEGVAAPGEEDHFAYDLTCHAD
jgi:hypothetical protein